MNIKFSIFASKVLSHSLSRHHHEFRHVHAIQTVEQAQPAGIITYTQGFAPFAERGVEELLKETHGPCLDELLPLPRFHEANADVPPATILSRLEFPNYQVVNGTFKSPQYQATSGAHVFADPQVIYITEELESLDDEAKALVFNITSPYARRGLARARLLVALAPTEGDFKAKWDAHAKSVHEAIAAFVASAQPLPLAYLPHVEYQRYQTIGLSQSELDSVLDGSPFRNATFRPASGGYEEFAFLHTQLLIDFLNKYSGQLRVSYKGFAKVGPSANSSELSSFVVVCDEAQFVSKTWRKRANANYRNENGETPLYIAACLGHAAIVERRVAAGAHVDLGDRDKVTPVLMAAQKGQVVIVTMVLVAGATVHLATTTDQCTPLLIAAQNDHAAIVTKLVAAGANVDCVDTNGDSPLTCPASEGYDVVARLLIDAGADPHSRNKEGHTITPP